MTGDGLKPPFGQTFVPPNRIKDNNRADDTKGLSTALLFA